MIIIKAGDVCPFSSGCPHNLKHTCMGEDPNRGGDFSCGLVTSDGIYIELKEGLQRSNLDITGRMEFIQE